MGGWPPRYAGSSLRVDETREAAMAGRAFFEGLIRDHLDVGRPDCVSLTFGRRVTARTPGAFRTKVVTEGVDPQVTCYYKASRVHPPDRRIRQPLPDPARIRAAGRPLHQPACDLRPAAATAQTDHRTAPRHPPVPAYPPRPRDRRLVHQDLRPRPDPRPDRPQPRPPRRPRPPLAPRHRLAAARPRSQPAHHSRAGRRMRRKT